MKKLNIILLAVLAVFTACSPRVDDLFDDTAAVRLEQNRKAIMDRLIGAQNGWVMQYFASYNSTASEPERHQGYTFLMFFREDGTVTIGAPVNGVYKTETSMWDIISDNSSVLTFNTFNSIFHYYSNPDPELGLWGADGIGYGGDYEFMVLEYNEKENYQLLKGKKNSCYVRMYPLAVGEDWEGYFAKLDAMDQFLFAENTPWDMYVGEKHFTLYNAKSHEFRAFVAGADTLGGGNYYGFITTDKGIRLHDDELLEAKIDRAAFNLSDDKKRLVSVINPNAYITVEGATVFTSDANNGKPWNIDMNALPAEISEACDYIKQKICDSMLVVNPAVANFYIGSMRFEGAGNNRIALRVLHSATGGPATSQNVFYYDAIQDGPYITLKADSTYSAGTILQNFGGYKLITAFDGRYSVELLSGFRPSSGIVISKTDSENFIFNLKH